MFKVVIVSYFLTLLSLSPVLGQTTSIQGGVTRDFEFRPTYRVFDNAWAFEAVTEFWESGERTVTSTRHSIQHPKGARLQTWRHRRGEVSAYANRPPDSDHIYTPQHQGIVWVSESRTVNPAYRPSRPSCLRLLLEEAKRNGKAATAKKYGLPTYIDTDKPWDILGEKYIGSYTVRFARELPPHIKKRYPNGLPKDWTLGFQVEGSPSGFGWPPLMFSLMVFDEKMLKEDGFTYRKVGEEVVGGVKCIRYALETHNSKSSVVYKVAYWVEPKTRLVLQAESVITPRGTRSPPIKVGYRTVKFRLLKQPPKGAFELPTGATVELPQLLSGLALPSHIKVRQLEGYDSVVGFPLKPYPESGARVVKE